MTLDPKIEEILAARQHRAGALHDKVMFAREEIRQHLEPDSPSWLRNVFNELHAAHHILGGDPFDMHIRAALSTAPSGQAPLEGVKALQDFAEWCDQQRSLLGAVDGYDYRSGEEYGLRRAQIETERRIALLPASAEPVDVLDILAKNVGWELSWGERDNDLSEVCWRVHCASGGRNDREWTLIGTGETPRAALNLAIVASGISVPPASGAVEAGWQTMDNAPKDRLIDIWLSSGVRWCDCYYDQICDEWRTSRPSGHLLSVKAAHVFYWREVPAAPTEVKP